MLSFNAIHFIKHLLALFGGLVDLMSKEIVAGSKREHFGVESWHMRLDMVEQEGLKQVASVNFQRNLFKQSLDFEVCCGNNVLDKPVSKLAGVVKIESFDSSLRQSEARKRVHAVSRFVNIMHDHH